MISAYSMVKEFRGAVGLSELVVLNYSQGNNFSNSDIHLREALANAMSMALENDSVYGNSKNCI